VYGAVALSWTACAHSLWGNDVTSPTEPTASEPTFPPYPGHSDDVVPVEEPIESIEALDYYYGKLTLTDLGVGGAITRASQWGDSVIGGDGLTEAIRQRMQRRFGDSGHGFHALGRYSRWYNHHGVGFKERRDWKTCLIIFKCESDRRYGYGGVSSVSRGQALSTWRTIDEEFGRSVSRFELWYQKRPDGGGFEIRVDGRIERIVDARAAEVSDDVETLSLADGAHVIDVAALAKGVARGYGVVLERDVPGAVWDELALIGSFTQRLDYQDPEHIAGQIQRRNVDLMVFMFGGNDLGRESHDLKHTTLPYEQEYARVIRKFRAGKPEASCMIMSLTDHARRVNGAIVTRPMVGRLVEAQRKVAMMSGCAFFDTYAAMGGAGAVALGRKSKPPLAAPDLRHPTRAGQQRIGTLLYHAMMRGYADYRRRRQGQPLPDLGAPSPFPAAPISEAYGPPPALATSQEPAPPPEAGAAAAETPSPGDAQLPARAPLP
jgi:lysophospholipase L1-like esterase